MSGDIFDDVYRKIVPILEVRQSLSLEGIPNSPSTILLHGFMPGSSTPVSSTTISSTPVSSTVISSTQRFYFYLQ